MKHVQQISKHIPHTAALDDHPNLGDSLSAFLKDPIGVISLHISALFG